MNRGKILVVTTILIIALIHGVFGQEKLAQTGMQFLSITPDARSAALGGAITTVENYSSAVFGNPAMLAEFQGTFDITLSRNNWIADIKHNALSASFNPWDGRYGSFAISLFLVDYGEIVGTIIASNEQGYLETGIISPNAFAAGVCYARALSEKFSVGGQIKYVRQYLGPAATSLYADPFKLNIGENELSVLAFDFGTIFKTGFKTLAFGMSVQNFSQEIEYAEESFQLPLTFNIGVSMNLASILPAEYQSEHILFSADAVHPRAHNEQVKFGLEYEYLDLLALRLGYVSDADEQDFTFGFGVKSFGFILDYAYTPFGVFDKVQRFTLRFAM
jgi:hypothetical protein